MMRTMVYRTGERVVYDGTWGTRFGNVLYDTVSDGILRGVCSVRCY